MSRLQTLLIAITLTVSTTAVVASPRALITHNTTDVESNAFIASTVKSTHPTKAHSDNSVPWMEVRMVCTGRTIGGKCSALIKMATNTANPVDIGIVSMDLNTGDITPKQISANGYTLIVNGPGETTLIAD